MKIQQLSDEAKRNIFPNYGEEYFKGMSNAVDKVVREAERYRTEQVVEWGEEPCPHPTASKYGGRKRDCPHCWQELKEEGK